MLELMEKYHWDYHTYMNQPAWVLELAAEKYKIEAKVAAKAREQSEHA